MKAFPLLIAAVAIAYGAPASATDATLLKAVADYNQLPAKVHVLAFGADGDAVGQRATRVPAWLADIDLTDHEARATAVAFGIYGDDYQINYRSREWSTGAWIAGGVAETVLSGRILQGAASFPDAQPNLAPSRALTEGRRSKLLGTFHDMGTCSGALALVVRKATALRPADDATRLLAKAQRDLGAAALPPDDSCLRR